MQERLAYFHKIVIIDGKGDGITTDSGYMKAALAEAEAALENGDAPVGAVIVKDGEIIARAHNTRERDSNPAGHAELLAIEEAGRKLGRWRLSDCTLYVTLEPCPMCAGAVVNARIPRVVCSLKDPRAGAFGSVIDLNSYPLNHRTRITYGTGERESLALLEKFFTLLRQREKRRGRNYTD